jgi:hypothetical protein
LEWWTAVLYQDPSAGFMFHHFQQFLEEMFLDLLREGKNSPHKSEPRTASAVVFAFLEPLRTDL